MKTTPSAKHTQKKKTQNTRQVKKTIKKKQILVLEEDSLTLLLHCMVATQLTSALIITRNNCNTSFFEVPKHLVKEVLGPTDIYLKSPFSLMAVSHCMEVIHRSSIFSPDEHVATSVIVSVRSSLLLAPLTAGGGRPGTVLMS